MVPSKAIKLQPRSTMTHGKWVADHMGHEHQGPHQLGGSLPYAQAMGSSANTKHPGRHGSFKHGSIAGLVMANISREKGKGISYQIMGAQEDNSMHLDSTPMFSKAHPHAAGMASEIKVGPPEPPQHHAPVRQPPTPHAALHALLDEDHIRMLLGKVDADLMAKIRAAYIALEALFKDADSNSDGLLNYFEVKSLFRRIGAGLADDVDKHVPEEERTSEPLINFVKFVEVFLPTALSVPTELLLTRIPNMVHGMKDRASVAATRKGASLFNASHEAGVLPDFSKMHHGHDMSRGHTAPHARRSSVAVRKIQEEHEGHFAHHGLDGHGHHGLGQHGHGHDDHGHGQLHGGGFRGHIHHFSPNHHRHTQKNIGHGLNEHGVGLPDLRRQSVAITGHGLVVGLEGLAGDNHHGQGHGLGHHEGGRGPRDSQFVSVSAGEKSLAGQATRRKSMAAKMRIGENLFQEKVSARSSLDNHLPAKFGD